MLDNSSVALATLALTLLVHLVSTVWWAASLTRRVEYIERWVASNARTTERLAAVEQRLDNLVSGMARIETYMRDKQVH
ncbi:MAG: hypothetical protein PW788_02675 [Micavibrio sp.]|nr:hypothetical protein [Micavibrio sp.]